MRDTATATCCYSTEQEARSLYCLHLPLSASTAECVDEIYSSAFEQGKSWLFSSSAENHPVETLSSGSPLVRENRAAEPLKVCPDSHI